jgi:hypothetical protein
MAQQLCQALRVGSLLVCGLAWGQTLAHAPPIAMTCLKDVLVWVNTASGIYDFQGNRYFGRRTPGKFVCEKDARAEGDQPTHYARQAADKSDHP